MTVGQRIAQKRKELGLSQEALGEQLSVSRQAIYKWESDATLPEIEKLIALSRIFHVSVGWLLGEEETVPEGELTEQQLRMVQEIVDRYLAALPSCVPSQPEPVRSAPSRRVRLAALAGLAATAILFVSLFNRLDVLDNRYRALLGSLNNMDGSVAHQINSLAGRVESILQSQNQLTAEHSVRLSGTDLSANTVTFSVRAVPRTFREGMTALLVARSGGESIQLALSPGPDTAFQGEITCPLTDEIEVSVVFLSDGQRQTQLLEQFSGLYSDSFPFVYFPSGPLWFDTDYRGGDSLNTGEVHVCVPDCDEQGVVTVKGAQLTITEVKVGLFREDRLLFWYDPSDPPTLDFSSELALSYSRNRTLTLDREYTYWQAARLTDSYGREWVVPDDGVYYDAGWNHCDPTNQSHPAPSQWNLTPLLP